MRQVHGADVAVVGVRRPDEPAPEADGLVTPRRAWCSWCGWPTACRCFSPTPSAASSAAVHAGRPGLSRCGAARRRRAARPRRAPPGRLGRPARVRRLLRGARRRCAPRSRPSCPRRTPRPRGARPRSTSAPGSSAQLATAGRAWRLPVEIVEVDACTRGGRRPVLLPAAGQGVRPARRRRAGAAVSSPTDATPDDAGAPRRGGRRGLPRSASGSPSACAEAGRSADEVTLAVVTKFFPASDVRLLADLGVTDVGENRHQEAEAKAAGPAPTSGCGGTSSAACRATRRPRSPATPTSSSPSTGPSCCPGCPRGAPARRDARLPGAGEPRRRRRAPGRARGGAAPGDVLPRSPSGGRGRGSAAARRDGGGAAGRGPPSGVRDDLPGWPTRSAGWTLLRRGSRQG